MIESTNCYAWWSGFCLWSTDAAGRVPHWSLTRPNARHSCPRVGATSELFFVIYFFHRFALTQLDSARLGFDSRRIRLIRPESGCIGRQPKWQKQAEIGLESCRNMSSHGGIGDDDDKVELLELGFVYGIGSILMFLFQVLHWDTLCLCL